LNDAVFPSRIAVFMCFVLVLGGMIRFSITNNSIKKNVKETERLTVKNFVEEKAVDKDEAEVDSENILKESSSREKRMEQVMYELWEQENDHENETVDAQEGLNEVKKLEKDVIGDDYEISSGSNLRKYKTEAENLNAVERNEEGVYSISEFTDNYKQEFSPVFVNNKTDADKASGLEEGRQYLESLKKDVVIDNKDSNKSSELEEGKKYLESLKHDVVIDRNDGGKTSEIEEGKKYLESLKNEGGAVNKTNSEKTNEIEEGKKYLESLKGDSAVQNAAKNQKEGESELEEGRKYLEDLKRNVMKDGF
ncbi:MAG: hypothetical protein IJU45_00890, partial [Clostridia bacterium]|nr:hypothetical protein [Clostridia bacterium]